MNYSVCGIIKLSKLNELRFLDNQNTNNEHIHSSDSNQSTRQSQVISDQRHVSVRVKTKSALRKERDRRYRDRHQDKINQRRRENRQNRQSLQSFASSSNGHSSCSSLQQDEISSKQVDRETLKKERDRKYRERHREEINQRRRERREKRLYQQSLQPNLSSVQSLRDNEVSSRQMEKNALRKERDRKYRELHREEINQRRRENRHRRQNELLSATEFKECSTENISTQASSEQLHHNLSDAVCIPENNNIKTENVMREYESEIPFGNEHHTVLETGNIKDNNVTVNVKVENEYDEQFAILKKEYPYELPVTKIEIQIKQEPYEKDEFI